MKLVYLEELPIRKHQTYIPTDDILPLLHEFIQSDKSVARVDMGENEYSCPDSQGAAIRTAIGNHNMDQKYGINVVQLNHVNYLVKTTV